MQEVAAGKKERIGEWEACGGQSLEEVDESTREKEHWGSLHQFIESSRDSRLLDHHKEVFMKGTHFDTTTRNQRRLKKRENKSLFEARHHSISTIDPSTNRIVHNRIRLHLPRNSTLAVKSLADENSRIVSPYNDLAHLNEESILAASDYHHQTLDVADLKSRSKSVFARNKKRSYPDMKGLQCDDQGMTPTLDQTPLLDKKNQLGQNAVSRYQIELNSRSNNKGGLQHDHSQNSLNIFKTATQSPNTQASQFDIISPKRLRQQHLRENRSLI